MMVALLVTLWRWRHNERLGFPKGRLIINFPKSALGSLCRVGEDVATLTPRRPGCANAEDEGRTVYDLSIRRDLITIGEDMVNLAYDNPMAKLPNGEEYQPHFFEPIHQRIFELADGLVRAGKLATPVTLKTFLPADFDVAGLTVNQYLARLAAEATTIRFRSHPPFLDFGIRFFRSLGCHSEVWQRLALPVARQPA
jgi:hypothetical protein